MTTNSQRALRIVAEEMKAQRKLLTQAINVAVANNQSLQELTPLLTDIRGGMREALRRIDELEREKRALHFRLQQLEKVR